MKKNKNKKTFKEKKYKFLSDIDKLKSEANQQKRKNKKDFETNILERKKDEKEIKEFSEKIKNDIKIIKDKKNQEIKFLNKKDDIKSYNAEKDKIIEFYYMEISVLKNNLNEKKFEYGKKYNTLNWKLRKWFFGIEKEFKRMSWSTPKNTMKYLGIVILIIMILALLFLAIDKIVNLI